jgi:hypothetical protein
MWLVNSGEVKSRTCCGVPGLLNDLNGISVELARCWLPSETPTESDST